MSGDKIGVYPKTGTITQSRYVRFTGVVKDGLFEVELPGAKQRAHAFILTHPKGMISASEPGFAVTLGNIVEGEAAGTVAVDDDLTPEPDGRVKKSVSNDRRCAGVAVSPSTAGKPVKILLRWATRP